MQVDCSGHSLGGALSSLMAHNLAHKYPTLAQANRLHNYTFGAPRVGNKEFCEDFNAMLGHSTFRVINKADVVPRCVSFVWYIKICREAGAQHV